MASRLAEIARGVGAQHDATGTMPVVDIIAFTEEWCGVKLFPVQRVIIKAHYGLKLDDIPDGFTTELLATYSTTDLQLLAREENPALDEKESDRDLLIRTVMRQTIVIFDDDTPWRKRPSSARWLTERGYLQYIHAQGRSNIREVIPGVERREMILSIGRRSGKCVEGDTLVLTGEGVCRIKDMGDPSGPEVQPLKVEVAQEGSRRSTSSHFYNGGVKETRRVTTHCGYYIAGTPNHRVRVMREDGTIQWRYLSDLQEGDYVGIHRGTNLWASTQVDVSTYGADWLAKAPDRIPQDLLRASKSVVCAFLRGLFDAGALEHAQTISFSTPHKRFGREVQTLLANLGVITRLTTSCQSTYVTVHGHRSQTMFVEKVGFGSQERQERFLVLADADHGRGENVPHQQSWVRQLLESIPRADEKSAWSRNALRGVLGSPTTYPRLRAAMRVAKEHGNSPEVIEHFESILEADYFFDPVTEVEKAEAHVFDLCVPDGVSFVANGMTNHNTHISACIAAYETYRTLIKGDPQLYYGLPPGEDIQLISVATDTGQAGILYNKVKGLFNACDYFGAFKANSTQTFARFQTPKDIKDFGRWDSKNGLQASINVTFRSCIAKGLRGAGNLVAILDEVAHFTNAGQSSAEEIYNAINPSLSALTPKDPKDKTKPISDISEGRMILISSPLGRQGQFYELFMLAMKGGRPAANMLAIQAPTWEVNLGIPAGEFEKNYAKDVNTFLTEYGGEFSSRTLGWLEIRKDLLDCVEPGLKPRIRGLPRIPHFLGVDFALAGDGTAVAIGHIEGDCVKLDYIDEIRAGLPGKYQNHVRLDYEEVADWILELSRRFLIEEGMFDQWAGIVFEQALQKRGLQQMKSHHMTGPITSQIYKNFKDMIYEGRLVLYDDMPDVDKTGMSEDAFREAAKLEADDAEIPDSPQGPISYLQELLELQATVKSKYVVEVNAPKIAGKHDDRSDALSRMIWLASQRLGNIKYIAGSNMRNSLGAGSREASLVKARLNAKRGGSHEQRQIRQAKRGGSRRPVLGVRGGRLKG